jgi:hypothetical protein
VRSSDPSLMTELETRECVGAAVTVDGDGTFHLGD